MCNITYINLLCVMSAQPFGSELFKQEVVKKANGI